MKFQTIRTVIITVCIMGSLAISCSKNEQPVQEPAFSGLLLQAITVDHFRLTVTDNGEILTTALTSPGKPVVVLSTYHDPRRSIKVYNFYGDELLLDTIIPFRGNPYTITFFQDVAGGRLRWIGPPVNEPLAKEGYMKVAIVYTAPQLPASLKVVVENTEGPLNNNYLPTDSFQLDKGSFSKYFEGRNLRTHKPQLKLYTTGADRKLLATVAPEVFDGTNPDYAIFLFDKAPGTVPALSGTKLY